jgi:hypothetical protein
MTPADAKLLVGRTAGEDVGLRLLGLQRKTAEQRELGDRVALIDAAMTGRRSASPRG